MVSFDAARDAESKKYKLALYLIRFGQIKSQKRDFRQIWVGFEVNKGGDGLCGFEYDETGNRMRTHTDKIHHVIT